MKFLRPLSLALVLSLSTITFATAVTPPGDTPSTSPTPAASPTTTIPKPRHTTGTIKSVDITANTFLLNSTSVHFVYAMAPDVVITKIDGTPGTVADLTAGTKVTIFYTQVDKTNRTANKINLKPASTKKTTKTTPSPVPATPVTAATPTPQ